jgi:hypothetical protein
MLSVLYLAVCSLLVVPFAVNGIRDNDGGIVKVGGPQSPSSASSQAS